MTEAEWLAATDPTPMLEYSQPTPVFQFLRERASERKLRLFGCGCCRHIWHLLIDDRSRKAVETAEQYADGMADKHELDRAYEVGFEAASSVPVDESEEHFPPAADAASAAFVSTCEIDDGNFWQLFRWAADAAGEPTARLRQAALLHDIFGNPFRPVTVDPSWLTSTVVALAEGIYADRAFDRTPVLADALQDAGCDNADILTHLRGDGPHVRGCWAVDLLLGKE